MVVVKPTRAMSVASDEEEVDDDDDDQEGADGKHQQVLVHGRSSPSKPRIADDGHKRSHAEDDEGQDFPPEEEGNEKRRIQDDEEVTDGSDSDGGPRTVRVHDGGRV